MMTERQRKFREQYKAAPPVLHRSGAHDRHHARVPHRVLPVARADQFVNTIRRHHTAHHNMGIMMKYNMNLTFPIADWFLGTSDLRRGLIGHLFNGYSEKHVKEELKPIIAKFLNDHSRVTLDGPQLTPQEESVMVGGNAAGRRAMAR